MNFTGLGSTVIYPSFLTLKKFTKLFIQVKTENKKIFFKSQGLTRSFDENLLFGRFGAQIQ